MTTIDRNLKEKTTQEHSTSEKHKSKLSEYVETTNSEKAATYDTVVIFGDTDLKGHSTDRAKVAAGYKADTYVVLGTEREQNTIVETLEEHGVELSRIRTTPISRDTEGNIESLIGTGLLGPKQRIMVVSHEPHANRLQNNFLNGFNNVEYNKIPEHSWRRRLEHNLLSRLDNKLRSAVLANAREELKKKVEKE